MPSPTRGLTQPERVEISNRKMIEAAAELIAEKGWEATTAAEIGRRAGYSRAMVHARYGSKDGILEVFFEHDYIQQLTPALDPNASGMSQAVAHFGHLEQLYAENQDFLRAMFVATFEATKATSALRGHVQKSLQDGNAKVEAGLRKGLRDGSVRADIDLDRARADISAVAFGLAYQWLALPDGYDLPRELNHVRSRLVQIYGVP